MRSATAFRSSSSNKGSYDREPRDRAEDTRAGINIMSKEV